MADNIAGLFTDPNSFRNARIDDLMKQRAAIGQMGGSMSGLLGQVAAGGGATGSMMAEGLGGLFGLSTPEEKKAAELQAMAESGAYDLSTSAGLANFAKDLNGLGYTKEAVMVLEKRNSILDRETAMADRERKLAQGTRRESKETIMVNKLDSKGRPVMLPNGQPVMEPKTAYFTEEWNDTTKKWERVGDTPKESKGEYMAGWDKILGGGNTSPTTSTPAAQDIPVSP